MRGFACLVLAACLAGRPVAGAAELQTFPGCSLVVTEWADGDSFLVRFPGGEERTLRLYGADCIEWHVADQTDARRLRAQRRYFGISGYGGDPASSIAKAKALGESAALKVRQLLSKEFTVITAFADARGDGKHERFYGFVQLRDGRDIGEVLVASGLARAFGVYRSRPGGQPGDDYRGRLEDLELKAAKLGVGAWQFTDWEALPDERKAERDETAELAGATDGQAGPPAAPVDLNTAARDELMRLPGIGETIANRIIEAREDGPYTRPEDLSRVPGIGVKTIEKLRDFLTFAPRR